MKLARAIGLAIKERRKAKGLSQEKLARIMDTYPHRISEHETGAKVPGLVTLLSYCAALECELAELVADARAIVAAADNRKAG